MKHLSSYIYLSGVVAICLAGTGCKKLIDIPGNAPTQIVTSQVFAHLALFAHNKALYLSGN